MPSTTHSDRTRLCWNKFYFVGFLYFPYFYLKTLNVIVALACRPVVSKIIPSWFFKFLEEIICRSQGSLDETARYCYRRWLFSWPSTYARAVDACQSHEA